VGLWDSGTNVFMLFWLIIHDFSAIKGSPWCVCSWSYRLFFLFSFLFADWGH
jgi:hypothetical protein